jgi:hypothetical protein
MLTKTTLCSGDLVITSGKEEETAAWMQGSVCSANGTLGEYKSTNSEADHLREGGGDSRLDAGLCLLSQRHAR